ncbi:MAG: hypothetical protein ACOC9P_01295 [bacterium]
MRYEHWKYGPGDIHDFQHAAAVLPYCDALFTNRKLAKPAPIDLELAAPRVSAGAHPRKKPRVSEASRVNVSREQLRIYVEAERAAFSPPVSCKYCYCPQMRRKSSRSLDLPLASHAQSLPVVPRREVRRPGQNRDKSKAIEADGDEARAYSFTELRIAQRQFLFSPAVVPGFFMENTRWIKTSSSWPDGWAAGWQSDGSSRIDRPTGKPMRTKADLNPAMLAPAAKRPIARNAEAWSLHRRRRRDNMPLYPNRDIEAMVQRAGFRSEAQG